MLCEPGYTQFDLNFSLFGIHVRVHPGHWLMSGIMGYMSFGMKMDLVLLWIVCVFVSILIHELGHVFVGQLFGSYGNIVLYNFGGLAIGSSDVDTRWKRIAVFLGGPGAGFILGGIAWGMLEFRLFPIFANRYLTVMIFIGLGLLKWINIAWGLMNLLPVFPLDGGQISRELWLWGSPRRGMIFCLRLSIGVAVLVALHSLACFLSDQPGATWHYPPADYLDIGGLYTTLMFASLAAGSYQMLMAQKQFDEHWEDKWDEWRHEQRDHWER